MSVKQLNGRFLVGRRTGYRTLYESETMWLSIYAQIKHIQSSERYLQWKRSLLSVLFNFSKNSPLQYTFWLWQNSFVWFWILYLWVKCNPKNSILQINAVQCVYVELCYKIFTSTYKKSNYNIDISNVSDLPFDGMCFFLEKWSRSHSSKRTNDPYVSQNSLRKKTVQMFWHYVRVRR